MLSSILPDDIIATQILPRSSAKSLLRFRSVCKTWNKLISDPMFINLHLNMSVERKAMHITLAFNTSPVTIYSLDPENPTSTLPDYDINAYPPPFTSFNYEIGSCDGLVCTRLNYGSKTISVWNASTRTHMTFPYQGHSRQSSYGFIFYAASRDYKLVSVRYIDTSHSSQVTCYSTGDAKGKLVGDIPYQMIPKKAGVVANGAVHWLALNCMPDHTFSNQVIVAFNPTCQKFVKIPIPANKKDGLDGMDLAQLGGSLSIVFTYSKRFEVWLMKECGVKVPWTIYFVVSTEDVYYLDRPLRVVPLYITKNGDLILQINYTKLFLYDQKQKSLKSIRIKYPETGLHLIGNTNNQPFYAITLLDSLVGLRNSNGGGQFLGRKNKRESCLQGPIRTLTHCSENHITVNMRSDSANDSTDEDYGEKIYQRYLEIVINTSDRKLYKLLKECRMDLEAAAKKFGYQALVLALSEIVPYMKREVGVIQQQISEDATAENLRKTNMRLDTASTRQIQLENDSSASYGYGYGSAEGRASVSRATVSSSPPERANNGVGVRPMPELGASMSHSPHQKSQEDNKVYQHNQNQQLPRRLNGLYARIARLAILLASSKFDPDMKRELGVSLQQISRDAAAKKLRTKNTGSDSASIRQIRVENDSNASYGSAEGKAGNSQSAVTGNDANVSSAPEGVNNVVCGIPHNQNQQLPGWAKGQHARPSLPQSGEQMGIFQDPRFLNVIIDVLACMQLPPSLSTQYGALCDPNHSLPQLGLFQDPRFHNLFRKALTNLQEPIPPPSAQQSNTRELPPQ